MEHQIKSTKKLRPETTWNRFPKFPLHILPLVLFAFLFACKSKKNLSYQQPPKKSVAEVVDNMQSGKIDFQTLSFKAAVKTKIKGDKKSFKSSVRIQRDSALWTTITFAGKPLFTALISQDTLKYMNKITKEYFIGEFAYLNAMLGTDLNYGMLQDLVVGDPLAFDTSGTYYTDVDSAFYLLSSLPTKKIEKELAKGEGSDEEYIFRYWVHQYLDTVQDYQINRQMVNKLSDTTSIEVRYSEYLMDSSVVMPMQEEIWICSPSDTGSIEMSFSKLRINEPVTFPFRITSKYKFIGKRE